MFKKVFIPNRGEIALRIIRSCKELGLTSIIGYSEADKSSLPVACADERICIGPSSPSESYLNIPSIISAIEITGAEAVHPGYGFLAESIPFVEVCEASKILFIGPTLSNIQQMGDKALARKTAKRNKVPINPGYDGAHDYDKAFSLAKKIGFPVIIKACGGGGGRGMRIVYAKEEFETAWETCSHESKVAFDNPELYFEKFIERPRHVEVQILGDRKGNIVVFPERDCSVQRRHQKIIEESPSPIVDSKFRKKLMRYAYRIAKSIGYVNAGTIEFLVDSSKRAYFIEMNTRIQVEHPITEIVSGVDLVKSQFLIAQGEKLDVTQKQVGISGYAIECRINAEDPDNNFMPCPGTISRFIAPGGPGIRLDTHIFQGYEVPPYYDSLLAKLISYGATRTEAIERMLRALDETVIEGVKTTIPILKKVLMHPLFLSGRYFVGWIEKLTSKE